MSRFRNRTVTEMHSKSKDVPVAEYKINEDLKRVNQWFCDNRLICNTKKTETMEIASQKAVKITRHLNIFYGDSVLNQKRSFKYLGVIGDESLSWNSDIPYVASRVYPKLKLLNRFSSFLGSTILLKIFKVTILVILDYGSTIWESYTKNNSDFLE